MAKVAVIFLTPHCNMRCDFCGAEAGFEPIPYDEAASLVDRLAREGTQSVVLGGGEPFLWPHDLIHLARRVRQRGMLAQVGSNGTLAPMDDTLLHEFDRWILPLESVAGGVHDAMRHFAGGHQSKILRLMERLRVEQVQATISSLVSRENTDGLMEVGALLSWYKKNGGLLHAWHLYRFLPVGRGGSFHAGRFATERSVFDSLGALVKSRFDDLQVYLRPDMYHSKETSFYWWQDGAVMSQLSLSAALPAASR